MAEQDGGPANWQCPVCGEWWPGDVPPDVMTEARARELLGDAIFPSGGIDTSAARDMFGVSPWSLPWAWWPPDRATVTLDGDFTVEQLEAIVWWMTHHAKEPQP